MDGRKHVLGIWLGDGGEGAKYWLSVLTEIHEDCFVVYNHRLGVQDTRGSRGFQGAGVVVDGGFGGSGPVCSPEAFGEPADELVWSTGITLGLFGCLREESLAGRRRRPSFVPSVPRHEDRRSTRRC